MLQNPPPEVCNLLCDKLQLASHLQPSPEIRVARSKGQQVIIFPSTSTQTLLPLSPFLPTCHFFHVLSDFQDLPFIPAFPLASLPLNHFGEYPVI